MRSNLTQLIFAISLLLSVSINSLAAEEDTSNQGGLVQLLNNLDEPRGVCFDIAGFRDSIDYHIPIQAHTCKPDVDNREDTLFIVNHPKQGNIYNAEYDRCLDTVSIVERGNAFMRPCTDSPSQVFNYTDQELQQVDATNLTLCLSASPSPSHPSVLNGTQPNPGVTFVARTLAMANCESVDAVFKKWQLPN